MMKKDGDQMAGADFGAEIAKILPLILREFARKQKDLFLKVPLTLPQIVVIELLADQGPCKMNELAKTLNFTMSAVTAIVDKIINLKLVKRERSSEDRRVVNVILVNKGREIARCVKEGRRNSVNEMFSVLTEKDKTEYIRILKKVYNNLKRKE